MSTNLIDASVTTPAALTSRTFGARFAETVNVRDHGAIADGDSHQLSERYGSLAAAQVAYPFATALTQQIDYCALKSASNAAFGSDGSEHGSADVTLNRPIFLPAGQYILGNDTWLIRNLAGGMIGGAGKRSTILRGNSTILAFDGVWYTEIADMAFEASAVIGSNAAVVELDGNVPGQPYATRGVQAVVMRNVLIAGGGSDYCLAVVRQGGSGAQGSECEFINLHMSNAALACYTQNGFNALDNCFFGGDCQTFDKNALEAQNGTINVYGMSFESQAKYEQFLNGGADINIGAAGAIESCTIIGCRSESMRFLIAQGGVNVFVAGCTQNPDFRSWGALTAFTTLDAVRVLASDNTFRAFKVTTAGTSGATEPVWPLDLTTVNDGSIVWEEQQFNWIQVADGFVEEHSCQPDMGFILYPRYGQGVRQVKTANYQMQQFDKVVAVDATAGAITIKLPWLCRTGGGGEGSLQYGKTVTIKKIDTSANAVTISTDANGMTSGIDASGTTTTTIPGGSRGWKTLTALDVGAPSLIWYITGSG